MLYTNFIQILEYSLLSVLLPPITIRCTGDADQRIMLCAILY